MDVELVFGQFTSVTNPLSLKGCASRLSESEAGGGKMCTSGSMRRCCVTQAVDQAPTTQRCYSNNPYNTRLSCHHTMGPSRAAQASSWTLHWGSCSGNIW